MKFSIVGSGNVAHHFAEMLCSGGHQLLQVWSRDISHAGEIASKFKATVAPHLSLLSEENQLIVVAVKDDVIGEVAQQIPVQLSVIHTSGSLPADIFPHRRKGVVWPIYSLTKGIPSDYGRMPIIIEAGESQFQNWLVSEFSKLSRSVRAVSGADRSKVHLAAVFANNFTNQMYDLAKTLMEKSGLTFDLLLPIIEQETEKIHRISPSEAQTGPGRRADMETINTHLKLLADDPEAERIYKSVTDRILKIYHDKKL